MDKLTSLNLTFDKILIQLVIPGFVAICPWFFLALQFHQQTKAFLASNNSASITLIACLSLIAGLIIENFGSFIEVHVYDNLNQNKDDADFKDYDAIWRKYLQLSYEFEPIGQRYIRNILMRMKFELSMGVSMIIFNIGLFCLSSYVKMFDTCFSKLITLLIPILLSIYLIVVEGYKSSKVLTVTRKLLVDKYYDEIGKKCEASE
jgi:hypothetical protein